MKNPRIKNKFIAMLVAAILILSSASVGLAAINEDNIDSKDLEPQTPDLVGMLQDNYVRPSNLDSAVAALPVPMLPTSRMASSCR